MKQKLKNLWNYFTTYEKIWFISITVLAFVFAIIFPEEDFGGVNGKVIMALYLLDIFLNITCELLISKQSKWNFIVSLGVEITEILICVVLSYRFATMATTLFFWIPIDIISFINWNRHKDREQEELREKLLRLNEEITEQEEQSENIDRFISKVRKYLDLNELTPAVLNDMVKAVYVHAPDKSKGHREQQIDISYDLVEILPASLLNDLHNRETS